MVPVVDGVRIVVASVRGHIMSLAGGADVSIHDYLAVDRDLDAVALNTDFLGAPLSQRLVDNPLCGDDALDGTMDLVLAKVGVHRGVMV